MHLGLKLENAEEHAPPQILPVREGGITPAHCCFTGWSSLENHLSLQGRIEVDDPDDFSEMYLRPAEHIHGTSMASLIIHGDMNNEQNPPT
jgi:hypothetical protein